MGTDKTPTCMRLLTLPDGKKQVQWLGYTSMPAASAPHIIKTLDAHSNGQNGLGLSIGTGFEWVAFVQKLSRAQLLYVYEPDLANLRMALEICDLARLLEERRIILLAGTAESAAQQLAEFLARNIGFDPPAVLHPLPTLMGERRNPFLSAGEAIVRRAVLERQALLNQLHEKLARDRQSPDWPGARTSAHPPAVLAFLLTPRYPLERPIQQQIPQLAAPAVYLDRHDTASVALRFELLARHAARGPVRIFSDLFRAQLSHLPAEISIETWIPPLIGPAFWERLPPAETFSPGDKIIVHHAHHADLLKARGIPEKQIEIRLLDSAVWKSQVPNPVSQKSEAGSQKSIALLADLPITDPAALGIQLPTHLAVFAAAREMIVNDYLTVHPGMAADILRRALTRAGVDPKIDDPALKDAMLRIIRDVLIPAVPLLTLAVNLAKEGLPLLLIGDWLNLQLPVPSNVEFVRFEEMDGKAWARAGILVHLDPRGIVSATLLGATANGTRLVHAAHPTDRLAGSLPQYVTSEKDFPAPQNLIATLKQWLRDPARPGLQLKR